MNGFWNVKKTLCLIGAILGLFLLISPTLPLYPVLVNEMYRYSPFWDYYNAYFSSRMIAFLVVEILSLLIMVASIAFFIRSIASKPLVGDKQDKFYVYGFTCFILAYILWGAISYSMEAYIPVAVGIVLALGGIVAIVVHFKVLSDI